MKIFKTNKDINRCRYFIFSQDNQLLKYFRVREEWSKISIHKVDVVVSDILYLRFSCKALGFPQVTVKFGNKGISLPITHGVIWFCLSACVCKTFIKS